ncbi:LysR family transcriptional regulator [Paraburkholderia tropica]|uniref:LysR family transcriptional regulator n=1 Tax=Paraburkholderia tropica TaxID=92647 RepID=UPI003D270A7A
MDRVLHAMSVFTHVARMGSFTAAAEALGVTAASTSTVVRQLEARLNVTLLQRSTRSMRLTTEGTQYYEHCLRVLGDIDDMERHLKGSSVIPRGRISINVAEEIAHTIVPPIGDFLAHYPTVDLRIGIEGDPLGIIDKGVDCAIVVGNLANSSLRSRTVGSCQAATVASPDYLRAHGVPRSVLDLHHHTVIHYSLKPFGSARYFRFNADGDDIQLKLVEKICVSSTQAMLNYAVDGVGVAQLCRLIAARDLSAGRLVEILDQCRPAPLPVSVLYSDRRHMPMSVRAFIDWVVLYLQRANAASSPVANISLDDTAAVKGERRRPTFPAEPAYSVLG